MLVEWVRVVAPRVSVALLPQNSALQASVAQLLHDVPAGGCPPPTRALQDLLPSALEEQGHLMTVRKTSAAVPTVAASPRRPNGAPKLANRTNSAVPGSFFSNLTSAMHGAPCKGSNKRPREHAHEAGTQLCDVPFSWWENLQPTYIPDLDTLPKLTPLQTAWTCGASIN